MNDNHTIAIPHTQYEEFIQRVMAMKPRKRKNFKGHLVDAYGVNTKVIWRDGKFYNWSEKVNQYCRVKSWEEVVDHCNTNGCTTEPVTPLGEFCLSIAQTDMSSARKSVEMGRGDWFSR